MNWVLKERRFDIHRRRCHCGRRMSHASHRGPATSKQALTMTDFDSNHRVVPIVLNNCQRLLSSPPHSCIHLCILAAITGLDWLTSQQSISAPRTSVDTWRNRAVED
ncbi:hypothetical protein FA15DRAFT_364985 [Coprinopsis marcescibilis]|uniref:Uncharacterized protein n=1 Tax=Coprinopsis marcescibilis TaxID=230819 RepID=A0A5C3KYC4_COPMA|nr:hypothetical protein FA15DRAFT_364985 [Coprinopsis marcescibilis]